MSGYELDWHRINNRLLEQGQTRARLGNTNTWLVAVASLMCLLVTGCGNSDRASVSGVLLRHDGTPLVAARVIARSEVAGASVTGLTDQAGYFKLGTNEAGNGVPPGDYYVIVVEDRGELDNRRPPSIAAKYEKPSSSGIMLSVAAGDKTELNLTLDKP